MKLSLVIPSALVLASLTGGVAFAQPAPTPGAAPAAAASGGPMPGDDVLAPPPPPPGPRGYRPPPPPPPRGASIRIERDAGGIMRLDVHCGESDTTKSCADVTLALLDKITTAAK
jgi:hypothetical protein